MDPSLCTESDFANYGSCFSGPNTDQDRKEPTTAASSHVDEIDSHNDADDHLPRTVSFALFIVGMWSPYRASCTDNHEGSSKSVDKMQCPLITMDTNRSPNYEKSIAENRPEHSSSESDELGVMKDADFLSLKGSCTHKPFTKRPWRECVVEVFAILYLSAVTAALMIDGGTYVWMFWGKSKQLLYMISYVTYVLQVLLIPAYCLAIRVSDAIPGLNTRERCPLSKDFISRSVGELLASGHTTVLSPTFFLFFMGWPLGLVVSGGVAFLVIPRDCHTSYFIFSDITSAWGYFVYGIFWYLMYITRKSLHQQLNNAVRVVKRASLTDDVDNARKAIRRVHRDYFIVRELMGMWMAITMVTSTWGLMSRLTWDYAMSSRGIIDPDKWSVKVYLDIYIWSEKLMFLLFPCVALGGINLEYLWRRFRHVVEGFRTYQHRAFWMSVQLHTSLIDHVGRPELKWTIIFALVGPYLTLQAGIDVEQNLEFWNGPFPATTNCSTNVSLPFFPVK